MSSPSIRIDPCGRRVETGDHAKQRGLAAARGSEQADELAVRHGELHFADRSDSPNSFVTPFNTSPDINAPVPLDAPAAGAAHMR